MGNLEWWKSVGCIRNFADGEFVAELRAAGLDQNVQYMSDSEFHAVTKPLRTSNPEAYGRIHAIYRVLCYLAGNRPEPRW